MQKYKHVIWELVLILASVLFFRSLWLLMDKYLIHPNEDFLLWSSFIAGIILAAISIHILTHEK
ncbi:hypothetical protein J4230_01870 [Candidatus Woesearchaeota archaeon]|nr:hypothetical protein [Candidatus Woesearchaeota archaeon]